MKKVILTCTTASVLSVSMISSAQTLECAHVKGQPWRVNSEADAFLFQSGGGAISGYADPDYCAPGWPVDQSVSSYNYSSGEFNIRFDNPNGINDFQYGCAPWVKLNEGDLSEPGCNEGTFDLENPATTIPSSMDKMCELPTGELNWGIGVLAADPAIAVFEVYYSGFLGPWAGRRIQQWTDWGWGYDTCYIAGGPDPYISLEHEGFEWIHTNYVDTWVYYDNVGRPKEEVDQFRQYNDMFPGHLPCGNGFRVDLDMHCGLNGYVEYLNGGLLEMEILNDSQLWITRGGTQFTFGYVSPP